MKVLIIKNISREGAGILRSILDENKIQYDIIETDAGEDIPDPLNYDALFVFGGPDSANDNTAKMTDEVRKVKKAIDNSIPYLGICLGMQVLVKAGGGSVRKNDVKEIGFKGPDGEYFEVKLCVDGDRELFLEGLEDSLKIFHLHSETVDTTNGMKLLATGKFCRNQIIKVGKNAYGVQGHFELTPGMLDMWLENDSELKVLDVDKIRNDFLMIQEEYTNNAKKIFNNFLKIAGILEE